MRILLVNDYREVGGAERVVAVEAQGLRAAGHEVEVLVAAESPGVLVGGARAGGVGAALRYVSNGGACRRLAAALDRFDPDVVHLHNMYHEWSPAVFGVLGRWKRGGGDGDGGGRGGRGVVLTAHDAHVICPNPGGLRFVGGEAVTAGPPWRRSVLDVFLTRWDEGGWARSVLRAVQHVWHYRVLGRLGVVDAVVALTAGMRERLAEGLEAGMGSGGPGIVVVPNAVVVPEVVGERAVEGALRLVFAGRVEPEKGLLAALGEWPVDAEAELVVLGDGSELAACRAVAAERGLAVRFEGRVSGERVAEALAGAHGLFVPSVMEESDPLSVSEALAAGAAVLGSDQRPLRGLLGIADGASASDLGMVFAWGGLAGAIGAMAERRRLGVLNGFDRRAAVAGRSVGAHVEALVGVYAGVVAGGGGA